MHYTNDKGTRYRTGAVQENGQPRDSEMFMTWISLFALFQILGLTILFQIPQFEHFGEDPKAFELPSWLPQNKASFKVAIKTGNTIANCVLGVLEQDL